MINVVKTVIEDGGKYLFIRRKDDSKFFPGQWDFPGGKLYAGEEPSDGAARETREETSLNVIIDQMILEEDHTENETQIHYKLFSTSSYEGEVKLGQDHSEFKWLSMEEVHDYLTTPFVKRYFEEF